MIHLAAKVQPDAAADDDELWRVNVDGTKTAYAAAVGAGCRLFVYMSSAGVYGSARGPEPFGEDSVIEPVTPYQRTKWEAEQALRERTRRDDAGDPAATGIYGPGRVSDIASTGRSSAGVGRSSCAAASSSIRRIEDAVQAIVALVDVPPRHDSVFNLGGERPLRAEDWYALVAAAVGARRRRLRFLFGSRFPSRSQPIRCCEVAAGRPPLREMARGRLFNGAVDDRRFRLEYPASFVPSRSVSGGTSIGPSRTDSCPSRRHMTDPRGPQRRHHRRNRLHRLSSCRAVRCRGPRRRVWDGSGGWFRTEPSSSSSTYVSLDASLKR